MALSANARAEAPMITDDAGTLDKGEMKLEAGLQRTGSERGQFVAYGLAPIDNLELGIALQGLRDRNLSARGTATTLSAKWIPYQTDLLSAGVKLESSAIQTKIPGLKDSSQLNTLTGLASWRWPSGHALHANLGYSKESGNSTRLWAVGGELPVHTAVQLTADVYGSRSGGVSQTGQQVGVRWAVKPGLKVSLAWGRTTGASTGSLGTSWEF